MNTCTRVSSPKFWGRSVLTTMVWSVVAVKLYHSAALAVWPMQKVGGAWPLMPGTV